MTSALKGKLQGGVCLIVIGTEGGRRMMHAADFAERMQLIGSRRAEQVVPGVGADPHDT